jgi:hypothetical protein
MTRARKGIRRHPNLASCVVGLALAIGIWLVLAQISGASELGTVELFALLGGLILLSGGLVSLVLGRMGVEAGEPNSPVRHLATGLGLLFVGTVLAISVLPEDSTGSLSGGVGFLPPARARVGFQLALLAQPHGCSGGVPVKFVAVGSNAYWSDPHWAEPALRNGSSSFVLALPGEYHNVWATLGPKASEAPEDPIQDESAYPHAKPHGTPGLHYNVQNPDATHRGVTVVSGLVARWPVTRRALIVNAVAPWITHRGIGNCNLQLPALSGAGSAAALAQALTCPQLNSVFAAGSCTPPPPEAAAPVGASDLASWLETARGETAVTGSDVSSSDSDPQPTVVRGSPEWRCASSTSSSSVQVAREGVTGNVVAGGDCHAVAAVVASAWHRDLVLVLLGAFIAVGVHMLFQGMIEGVRARAQGAAPDAGATRA